jgi:predicted AlkP superfamily phosphohydrolase/phosphomutase
MSCDRAERAFLFSILAVTLSLPGAGCSKSSGAKPVRRARQKVVVMGFDGMDPTLARRYMDEGKLPNLKRLAESGTFATLGTTQPSESPVAWSSFATGVNPGRHNIYDFLVRDVDTYLPDLSMVKREPPEFLFGLIPTKAPKVLSTRGGTSFWVHAGRDGIRSVVLTVPVTFPPEEIPHGLMLSGLPLPDIRGTVGFFSYWSTDLASNETGSAEFGGFMKRLLFENGVASTILMGPRNPVLMQEERELRARKAKSGVSDAEQARLTALADGKDVQVPMTVRWQSGKSEVEIEVQGQRLKLKAGDWSDWVPLTFRINALVKLQGMTQFHVIEAGEELRIYAHPVNLDPRNPPTPISKPDGYAKRLADQIGTYRTLGWAEPTWAMNEGRIDEATFLYDCDRAWLDREKLIFKSLESEEWDLLVAAVETTDRIAHMMFRLIDPRHPMYDAELAARYGDSIEKIYRRADDLVGRIEARLAPGTALIVMSDHGFHSYRRSVNLNTWLLKEGYLAFEGTELGGKGFADLFGRGRFWEGVDWSRTRAYAVGLGPIYFNLKGREAQGIVSAGAEYKALQEEMAAKLRKIADPDDPGQPVILDVYRRDDIYAGEYLNAAPDLQVGFADGYRVGWQDTMGGISRAVVENNNKKWSGDHCATAREISGGVFFSNLKIDTKTPHIMDLGPTILRLLEVPLPPDLDGKPLVGR